MMLMGLFLYYYYNGGKVIGVAVALDEVGVSSGFGLLVERLI